MNNKPAGSLYTRILCYLAISVTIAIIVYAAVFQILKESIDTYSSRPDRAAASATRHVEILQTFIEQNELSYTDVEALALWNDDNWYTSLKIVDQQDSNLVYYDSFIHYASDTKPEMEPVEKPDAKPNSTHKPQAVSERSVRISWDGLAYPCFTHPLHFKDKDTFITISGPSSDQYGLLFALTSFFVFFLVFTCCFFLLSRRRFQYIQELQTGIETICAGKLDHVLPVIGDDELTSLAAHINNMSLSLQEQLRIEEDIRKKNSDVVAAISHDLRTPLTSVICYLDLLQDRRYPNEETQRLYIENARARAYQIKGMSDELFARSVQKVREDVLHWETLSGSELISQILTEMHDTLKENGLRADFVYTFPLAFFMKVDVTGFRRIFDNLTSNAIKYADRTIPLTLSAVLTDNSLHIVQRNVKSPIPTSDSAGLGLAAARKLVLMHGGDFEIRDNPFLFEIHLSFPVIFR